MCYECSFIVFFFKQKTAYEMRISDWSSDVCSSDLEGCIEALGERRDVAGLYAAAHLAVLPSYREGLPRSLIEAAACGRAVVTTDEIGRASCRERVCQYV